MYSTGQSSEALEVPAPSDLRGGGGIAGESTEAFRRASFSYSFWRTASVLSLICQRWFGGPQHSRNRKE